jgi:hypothetical protein
MIIPAIRILFILTCSTALAAAAPLPVELPAGTAFQIRLLSSISTNQSKPNDPIDAVMIAPVAGLPSGAKIRGYVESVTSAGTDSRARLKLRFEEIVPVDGKSFKAPLRLLRVDNARESLNEANEIIGILSSETLSAQLDRGLDKLAEQYSDIAGVLQAIKVMLIRDTDTNIDYPAGVEMIVALTGALKLDAPPLPVNGRRPDDTGLIDLVRGQPLRTVSERPPLPSDFTNLLFLGTRDQLEKAFVTAGWTAATSLGPASVLETARAIIEARGYKEAPVSTLRLEGRLPDMVLQKTNNTFAMRHHLRIWRRPQKYMGRDVWIGAATHDIGIAFDQNELVFVHRIEPRVDLERSKVIDDLTFTGLARLAGLIGRENVPEESMNATGDRMVTDGKMGVLSVGPQQ